MSAIEDYKILRKYGNIGFYDYCEIITIFLHEKKEKKNHNFFTLISFKEGEFEQKKKFLTEELQKINSDVSVGIIEYSVCLEEIDAQFLKLHENNLWDFQGDNLELEDFITNSKKFVPILGDLNSIDEPIPLNQIFNQFCGFWECHYFIEFSILNVKPTKIQNLLSEEEILKVCDITYQYTKFDFDYLNDKIGEIIFEFKNSIINYKPILLGNSSGIVLNLFYNPKILLKKKYLFQIIQEFDGVIAKYEIINNFYSNEIRIEPNDFHNRIFIIDPETNLIVFMYRINLQSKNDYINNILPTTTTLFISTNSQKYRTIIDKFGNSDKISLPKISAVGGVDVSENLATINRQYSNSINQLTEQRLLLTYRENEHKKAIDDIRFIINNNALKFDLGEICLWDPFLKAEDILETAYYCIYSPLNIRAITSWNKVKNREIIMGSNCFLKKALEKSKNQKEVKKFQRNQNEWIINHSNNTGVTLEFRCQHDQYGWSFHDRFLIINHKVNHPRVWSLGTSFNSLGKSHHIVQAVENPKIIVDAFEELWNKLQEKECLIYKS